VSAEREWEGRRAPHAAAAAFASALLSVASFLLPILLVGEQPGRDEEAEALRLIGSNSGDFLATVIAQGLSFVALALALAYLLRATSHRRPETPRWALGLIAAGPLLLLLGGILNQIALADIADEFVSSGAETNARAEDLLGDRGVVGVALASGGTFALALGLVLVSLNAMRAGLLSRFMGILGIIVGALLVLPLLPGGQSFVQLFWTAALGVLFLNRWPGGRGPAWEAEEAVPWPSAAQRAEGGGGQEVSAGAEKGAPSLSRAGSARPRASRRCRARGSARCAGAGSRWRAGVRGEGDSPPPR
jgi:membrane protein implicated in regulation of membrane protease activity